MTLRFRRLIGIAGRAGSGKDTIARHLSVVHGFHVTAFATPLKDILIRLGLTRDHFATLAAKETPIPALGKSPRQMMQTLGTDWGRNMVHEDLWIRVLEHRLRGYPPGHDLCVSDVRYNNEARWIREQGGVIWHIARADHETTESEHSSEAGVAELLDDEIIDNNGTLQELLDVVDSLLQPVKDGP
jgi:hypothetical protein